MDIVFLTVQYISLKMDHKFIPFMKYFKPITKMWSWLDNLKVCRMKVLNLLLYQIIVIIQGWIIVIRLNFGQKLNESLNMLIWPINLIILNITGSLIVLNAMIENENNSFANISSFIEHDLRREIKILVKLFFSFSIMVFNIMKFLIILFMINRSCLKTNSAAFNYVYMRIF